MVERAARDVDTDTSWLPCSEMIFYNQKMRGIAVTLILQHQIWVTVNVSLSLMLLVWHLPGKITWS